MIHKWVFYTRDFIARNFMVSPIGLLSNGQITFLTGINYLFYRILPFGFVKFILSELFNIGIIYKLDSIYNLTNHSNNHIVPIILDFTFVGSNGANKENFLGKIKYYNSNIPLIFIIKENNLEEYNLIKLKYLNCGKIIEKLVEIKPNITNPLYKLFD